jgi:hypothetical protein
LSRIALAPPVLWVGGVNAFSGVLGIRLALQWERLRAAMAEELRSASTDPPGG